MVLTNSGADALCLMSAETPPDIVLLDLVMPGIDGYDFLRRLGPSAPPIILMTGADIDDSQFETTKVVRVLRKPFDLKALMEAVGTAMRIVEGKEHTQNG